MSRSLWPRANALWLRASVLTNRKNREISSKISKKSIMTIFQRYFQKISEIALILTFNGKCCINTCQYTKYQQYFTNKSWHYKLWSQLIRWCLLRTPTPDQRRSLCIFSIFNITKKKYLKKREKIARDMRQTQLDKSYPST